MLPTCMQDMFGNKEAKAPAKVLGDPFADLGEYQLLCICVQMFHVLSSQCLHF